MPPFVRKLFRAVFEARATELGIIMQPERRRWIAARMRETEREAAREVAPYREAAE
jgi:hypothetical protein